MSSKPILLATHPRSCSTAFERVFMTRSDLKCIHEPFGDAFYYGPERLSARFEKDEKGRNESGFSKSSYQTIIDRIDAEGAEGRRIFVKDLTYYLLPPNGAPPQIAPGLARKKRGVGTSELHTNGASSNASESGAPYPYASQAEPGNPTVIPNEILKKFHFTFLIRHPRHSVPSYFRCTVPPLDQITGFHEFMPCEAGYNELRRFFDYLRATGQVGPRIATHAIPLQGEKDNGCTNGNFQEVEICVVDADDLLDNPAGTIKAYCKSVGMEYDEGMLRWGNEKDQRGVEEAFEKWKGFHEDAISSRDLKPRAQKKGIKTREEEDAEWTEKFGTQGAKLIRDTVDANVEDYEYLRQFAMKV